MDSRLLFGLGVSCVFGFVRWRFPALPKPLATFGCMIGIGLIAWSSMPTIDWRWAAGLIASASVIAAILDALISSSNKTSSTPASSVTFDQRVTSHAQTGGITARNIKDVNVDQ